MHTIKLVHELTGRRFRNCFKNTIQSRTLIVQKEQQTILQPSNHYIHNNTRVTFHAFMTVNMVPTKYFNLFLHLLRKNELDCCMRMGELAMSKNHEKN